MKLTKFIILDSFESDLEIICKKNYFFDEIVIRFIYDKSIDKYGGDMIDLYNDEEIYNLKENIDKEIQEFEIESFDLCLVTTDFGIFNLIKNIKYFNKILIYVKSKNNKNYYNKILSKIKEFYIPSFICIFSNLTIFPKLLYIIKNDDLFQMRSKNIIIKEGFINNNLYIKLSKINKFKSSKIFELEKSDEIKIYKIK